MSATSVLRMASPVRPTFGSSSSNNGASSAGAMSDYQYSNGARGPLSPTRGSPTGLPARALSPPAGSPFKTSQLSQSLDEALGDMPDDPASLAGRSAPVASTSRLPPPPPAASDAGGAARATSPAKKAGGGAPRNPLIDLIETEHGYVNDLAMIIKKVAAAWSRTNFPPPALDTMFRAIEAVYRIDKGFLARLNEIGPTPSSPKALGDLLMRWIDDLEPAYTRYVKSYHVDYDVYEPVQSNPNLRPILQALPPISSDPDPGASPPTLDALFALPLERLHYYKKLYAKLLKSTQPGKSDHNLLVGANEKLDWLLDTGRQSAQRKVSESAAQEEASQSVKSPSTSAHSSLAPSIATESSLASSISSQGRKTPVQPLSVASVQAQHRPQSDAASASGSSSVERSSGQTTASAQSTANTSETSSTQKKRMSPSQYLEDLERRLDTSRTLDIFSMKPKKCKLQMNPPGLSYSRSVRFEGVVSTSFVPSSDPAHQEVFTHSAHIFLLTDLFLMCETIPPQARSPTNPQADVWLSYPPLATKHLKVFRRDDPEGNSFEIEVMKREKITVFTESRQKRDIWLEAFSDAISFTAPSLRVNTELSRTASPNSATSARTNTFSPASWNTSSGGGHSPLPPLPLSASTPNFPGREASPADGNVSRYPQQADAVHGRQSPHHAPSHSLPLPPAGSQPGPMSAGPRSPMHSSFGEATNGQRPLPQDPRMQQPNVHPGYAHQGMPGQHQMQNGFPGQPANGQYPFPQSGHGMPPPNAPFGLQKAPSQRSMASFSSRSSKASAPSGSSAGQSPIPPLPTKDHHMDFYAAQQANGRMHAAMAYPQQDMRSGGLLSPSGSGSMDAAQHHSVHRSRSAEGLHKDHYRMPSAVLKEQMRGQSLPSSSGRPGGGAHSAPASRMGSGYVGPAGADDDISPPSSPRPDQPVTSQLAAEMKCKLFVQQAHGQWKSLGTAKLKLYLQSPTNQKQLVVASDRTVFISTIVLEDGVERVGKTGVAIELSDNGQRTGLVYMIQLKAEASATGLYQQLLMGSSRASAMVLR